MSNCKVLVVVVAVTLTIVLNMTGGHHQALAADLCEGSTKNFHDVGLALNYISKCLKSNPNQLSRYGKRAYSPLLGRLRPDLYNDYDSSWPTYDSMREN